MSAFRGERGMAIYESEHTRFIREWMKNNPQAAEEQKDGRALWWDKPQDTDTQRRNLASKVPSKAYYYDTNH
jgi:hypothetical protein